MSKKPSLRDVAKQAQVSVGTVSNVLNRPLNVSEETRLKVQAFAKLYHYKPNNIALSLKNRKTKTIGIIIPEIVHYFFSTVINGIEHVANENGYSVVICLSDDSFDKEVLNMEMLANGSIDGFIMSLSKETQFKGDFHHITEVISQGMPVVMFDRVTNDILCDKVIIDDQAAAYEAVQSLIDKGKKKIALVTTVDYVSVGKLRTDGYIKALLDNDIPFDENLIIKTKTDSTYTKYLWEPQLKLNYYNDKNPTFRGVSDQTYYLLRTDTLTQCDVTDTYNVTVTRDHILLLPNAFTPNGDGLNDVIKIINNAGIGEFRYLKIFNRFGKIVFQTNNMSEGWNGKVGDQLQQMDAYYYTAEYVTKENLVVIKNGSFILLN